MAVLAGKLSPKRGLDRRPTVGLYRPRAPDSDHQKDEGDDDQADYECEPDPSHGISLMHVHVRCGLSARPFGHRRHDVVVGMRDLDNRILGQRGVLAVAVLLTVAGLVGGIAATVGSDVAAAVVVFVVAAWAGYWSV